MCPCSTCSKHGAECRLPKSWSETVIIILILGGIQLTMLGVIGEYLWRTLDETRNRPNYFIEKDTNP